MRKGSAQISPNYPKQSPVVTYKTPGNQGEFKPSKIWLL